MTDLEWEIVHYDGNNDEPYADLVVDALRQKRETDALAAEYGIDAKTMLTLAKSQIKTTQDNIELSAKLGKAYAASNNAIYFADRSDYITALYEVCAALHPEIEDENIGKHYIED